MNKKKIPFHVEVVEDDFKWQLFLDQLTTSSTYVNWWWGDYKKKNGWNRYFGPLMVWCQLLRKM